MAKLFCNNVPSYSSPETRGTFARSLPRDQRLKNMTIVDVYLVAALRDGIQFPTKWSLICPIIYLSYAGFTSRIRTGCRNMHTLEEFNLQRVSPVSPFSYYIQAVPCLSSQQEFSTQCVYEISEPHKILACLIQHPLWY